MKITIVAAMSQNRTIGMNGKIPWMGKCPEDMRHFRNLTMGFGKAVLMGRKTYESMGSKPLSNRLNLVMTSDPGSVFKVETTAGVIFEQLPQYHAQVVTSHQEAVATAKVYGVEELFVIGGEQIYHKALAYADSIALTVIDRSFGGDAKFPIINQEEFRCWGVESHESKEFDFRFEYWNRIGRRGEHA